MTDDGVPFVSVAFPAYNEEALLRANFARLIAALAAAGADYEVLLVDDASTDATGAILDELARDRAAVRVLRREVNGGLSGAFRTALDAARGDWILLVPVDSIPRPETLRAYFAAADAAEVVVGCRPERAGYPAWARAASWTMRWLIRLLFGLHLRDYTWICLYRTAWLRRVEWRERSIAFLPEILVRLHRLGCRLREVDSPMEPRRAGRATVFRPATAWRALLGLCRVRWGVNSFDLPRRARL